MISDDFSPWLEINFVIELKEVYSYIAKCNQYIIFSYVVFCKLTNKFFLCFVDLLFEFRLIIPNYAYWLLFHCFIMKFTRFISSSLFKRVRSFGATPEAGNNKRRYILDPPKILDFFLPSGSLTVDVCQYKTPTSSYLFFRCRVLRRVWVASNRKLVR